jgi:hypothetical protein
MIGQASIAFESTINSAGALSDGTAMPSMYATGSQTDVRTICSLNQVAFALLRRIIEQGADHIHQF